LNIATVSKRYRFITSLRQLYAFEKQLESSGSRNEKIKEVWTFTYQEFVKAKENNLIIHDSDLKRWATRKSNELSLEKFTASKMWLWRFKQQYRIVSRKITKFFTRNYSKERDDQISTANLFINSSKLLVQDYTDCEIFNTDLSGFNKKIHSGVRLNLKVLDM
jgi:hypothetical protein